MLSLSRRHQFIIGLLLIALMALTRGHHFATLSHLPSATWAIFFLAGFYISSKRIFPLLLAQAALLDFAAITWGGVSSFCVSPAYALLLPAYGALWLAGRWYADNYQFSWATLLPLGLSLSVATVTSQILSSGGFYFFSGRYTDTTLAEFGQRFIQYYPSQLSNIAFYLSVTAVIHICIVLMTKSSSQQQRHHS
ncbi:MAG: hypothetical protein GQ548_06220 [Methylophaga sp.]|nr:hypothetical protein [Methylophaga sp.]